MYIDDQIILETHKDDQWSDLEGEAQGKAEACSSHCLSSKKNKLTLISKEMSITTNKPQNTITWYDVRHTGWPWEELLDEL